ncbi:Glyceraldehyde-3-phosphate dehydrogenase [Camelus dromedarius]|uniref:Glyceraldehyde-3-phosphate dehydrogenase n=1 Tax=Camelus dromedarius TaxID=9838 RepID=A0A5N4C4D1_CAMDR|nr:Glyceraldehyde-3-phosphate dehydrogenase [Camelus dromedarius]
MITVHIINSTLKNVNNPSGKLWHVDYGAAQIIIPANIDTTKVVGKFVPKLNGNFIGICVSIPNMSVIDLTCILEKAGKYGDIKKMVRP